MSDCFVCDLNSSPRTPGECFVVGVVVGMTNSDEAIADRFCREHFKILVQLKTSEERRLTPGERR